MILASGVSKGVGISRAFVTGRREYSVPLSNKCNVRDELSRVDFCIREAYEELMDVGENVIKGRESEAADIIHRYIGIINNQSLKRDIKDKIIKEETSAEHAIVDIMEGFSRVVRNLDDEYLLEKCEDIEEIKLRLLGKLTGNNFIDLGDLSQECIIVAEDITPGDVLNMNPQYVKGIVTLAAGPSSSLGAIARRLCIPMVSGAGSEGFGIKDGDLLIVDGDRGRVIINPNLSELSTYGACLNF